MVGHDFVTIMRTRPGLGETMPSFDVVSEVDRHELTNAVDQARRELDNRFDFKGTNAKIEHNEFEITLIAEAEFQTKQLFEILQNKMAKRGIDILSLELGEIEQNVAECRQKVLVRQGIDKDSARKIVKLIKEAKTKVQSQIQQEQVRVTGKKRDDLQAVIAMLKEADIGLPLQYTNFRD